MTTKQLIKYKGIFASIMGTINVLWDGSEEQLRKVNTAIAIDLDRLDSLVLDIDKMTIEDQTKICVRVVKEFARIAISILYGGLNTTNLAIAEVFGARNSQVLLIWLFLATAGSVGFYLIMSNLFGDE